MVVGESAGRLKQPRHLGLQGNFRAILAFHQGDGPIYAHLSGNCYARSARQVPSRQVLLLLRNLTSKIALTWAMES